MADAPETADPTEAVTTAVADAPAPAAELTAAQAEAVATTVTIGLPTGERRDISSLSIPYFINQGWHEIDPSTGRPKPDQSDSKEI